MWCIFAVTNSELKDMVKSLVKGKVTVTNSELKEIVKNLVRDKVVTNSDLKPNP